MLVVDCTRPIYDHVGLEAAQAEKERIEEAERAEKQRKEEAERAERQQKEEAARVKREQDAMAAAEQATIQDP